VDIIPGTYTLETLLREAGALEVPPQAGHIVIADDRVPPFKHQITGLNQTLANTRFGLLDEPGCGKTLPAQAYALYCMGYGNKVVALMPPVLLKQFMDALDDTFLGWQDHFTAHILDQGPKERLALFQQWDETGWPDLILMTYQMFINYPSELKEVKQEVPPVLGAVQGKARPTKVRTGPETYRVLREKGYNLIISDEAQALKNPSSTMHKAVAYLAGEMPTRKSESKAGLLLLTGTPLHNTPGDAYGIIKLLRPYQYGTKKSFERLHCVYMGSGREAVLIGYQNMDTLTVNLYASARRVLKNDVFKNMKTPIIREVPVTLSPKHKALYDKLVRERFLEVDGEIISAVQQQSLRQKCLQIVTTPQHFGLTDIKENNIITMVDTLLENIGLKDEKVILFAHYKRTTKFLSEYYEQYNPAVLYSDTKGSVSAQADKFKHDDTCRMLIAQPLSGGVGLNFQEVCAYVIFVEPLSVPGTFKQSSERVHRPGQKKQVMFYIIKALGTVAPTLTASMLEKEGYAKIITRDRVSMLDELMGKAA
jgi:SNF2 family DNA or RNA helicase